MGDSDSDGEDNNAARGISSALGNKAKGMADSLELLTGVTDESLDHVRPNPKVLRNPLQCTHFAPF